VSNTIPMYQRIKPCIDSKGHSFRTNPVPVGQFGSNFIYCTRCGRLRSELS
jgi:hypothetical protein